MVAYFKDSEVMCVAPAIAIHSPKGILQRIQQIEYLLGVFLRKAFASMNAVHITPGAFSAYRKSFFEKYGGFKRAHQTEDMEMALRIQSHNYRIENSTKAIVYTVAPRKFVALLKQRRRWYTGLLRNLIDYKRIFSSKYGYLGFFVLPVAMITVALSVFLTAYLVVNTLIELKRELILLDSVNFDVFHNFDFSRYILERYLFLFFSNPFYLFFVVFILVLLGYMVFAKTKVKEHANIRLSIFFFIFLFTFLFTFWWIISFFYTIFRKDVKWR